MVAFSISSITNIRGYRCVHTVDELTLLVSLTLRVPVHTHTFQARNVMYQHNHGRPMSVSATAQLLSNTLYMKRFFPYYSFCMVAGLDEQGEYAVCVCVCSQHEGTCV